MVKTTMDHEVARLLQERHTVTWMREAFDSIYSDLSAHADRDVSMNDVVSAFVCVMLREKEYYRSEFAINF